MEPSLELRKLWQSTLKHDFNNALTSIKTGLEIMAMDDHFEEPENAEDLNDVILASKRLSSMMEDLSFVFGDLPLPKSQIQKMKPSDFIEKLKEQLEHHSIDIEVDIPEEKDLSLHPSLSPRMLTYALVAINEFDRGTHPISLRFSKSGAHGWILHCSADIARELKEALVMKLNDSRASVLFQLAFQGCQNIGGSVNVKTQGEKGFVIFNCPA
jgi:signal transduction histidine kinase